MSLAAVLLAGGASTRMGSPKALLAVPGPGPAETFLDRLIRLAGAAASPVIVVLGHEPERIRTGLVRQAEAVFVVNQDYRKGQLSSLQCGLRAVPPEAEGVLFTPVDLPMIAPETFAELARVFAEGHGPLVVPRFRGRNGHPVCCSRELIPEFLELPAGAQARDVIHRHRDRTLYIDVDDPGILRDVDDPAAYRDLADSSDCR